MTDLLFDIIFRGDILPGHQLVSVKAQLTQLFKADAAQIQALFSGGAVPLKRNIDKLTADRYAAILAKAGADVQVVEAGSVKTAPRRDRRPPEPAQQQSRHEEMASARRMTLQERLAAQSQQFAAEAKSPARPEADGARAVEGGEVNAIADQDEGWAVLPPGSDVLKPSERKPEAAREVDTSGLSLRPAQGNLVDSSELPHVTPWNVGETDFQLGEVGADLLTDSEKKPPAPVHVQMLNVDLAPPGSDLGQLKGEKPPPVPDTSGLSLDQSP